MEFKASLDKFTKIITAIVTIVFIADIIFMLYLCRQDKMWLPILINSFLIIVYLLVYVYRPLGYAITSGQIIIKRFIGNVYIERENINTVTIATNQQLKGTIRIFGVGGLFGYFGKFANFELGSSTWYATRRKDLVLILTKDNKKIIISPDLKEEFVEQFSSS